MGFSGRDAPKSHRPAGTTNAGGYLSIASRWHTLECVSSETDRKPRQWLDRTPSLKTAKPDDGDTREPRRPKGCHQNSVDEPVDGQDLSTLKRRYECQPAQPLAHQRIPVLPPNLFTLKHRYGYAETPIRARRNADSTPSPATFNLLIYNEILVTPPPSR